MSKEEVVERRKEVRVEVILQRIEHIETLLQHLRKIVKEMK